MWGITSRKIIRLHYCIGLDKSFCGVLSLTGLVHGCVDHRNVHRGPLFQRVFKKKNDLFINVLYKGFLYLPKFDSLFLFDNMCVKADT